MIKKKKILKLIILFIVIHLWGLIMKVRKLEKFGF